MSSPAVNGRLRSAGAPRRRRQVLAASVLAACGLALFLAIDRFNPFAHSPTVEAVFDNAIGMAPKGTPTQVRLAGADVGAVTAVKRVGEHALITFTITTAAKRALRSNATATLRPRTPFEGTAYMDLQPGTPTAPPLSGTIPLEHTSNYVGLYSALSFLTASTRSRTQQLVRGFAGTLQAPAQRGLQLSLRTLPRLTTDLTPAMTAFAGPHDSELLGTVRGADRTFSAIASDEQNLVPFLSGAQRTFAALNVDLGAPLGRTLETLPNTLTALRTGSVALDTILARLDPVATDLQPGLQQLPGTLEATRPFLVAATPALTEVRPLVATLRRALTLGARATNPTDALLNALQPTLSVLNRSLLDALLRQTPVGLPAYLAVLNTLGGGAGAFANFQTPAQGSAPGQMGSGHYANFEGRFYTPYPTPMLPCSLFSAISPTLGAGLGAEGLCQR